MIARFFNARPDTQRVIYYRGRRPFVALLLIMIGYLIGYYAARDCRPELPLPAAHLPTVQMR